MSKKEKNFLNAKSILAQNDLQTEDVEVPEWGGYVRVRELTLFERSKLTDLYEQDIPEYQKHPKCLVAILSMGAINEDGAHLFSEEEAENLINKNPRVIDRICKVISKLSGMTGKEDKKGN